MAEDNNSFIRTDKSNPVPFEERKKDLAQYENVKQVRKKDQNAVIKWICDMFFSGRTMKEIMLDVLENQLVPQAKDNIRNTLVSILDLKIYKNHTPTPGSSTPGSSFITNYVKFSDAKTSTSSQLEATKQEEKKLVESGYESPAFRNKRDAENFISSLHTYVSKYERLTVLDLAWMQRKVIDFTWDKYGWDKEEILSVKAPTHINGDNPWMVALPQAHVLAS